MAGGLPYPHARNDCYGVYRERDGDLRWLPDPECSDPDQPARTHEIVLCAGCFGTDPAFQAVQTATPSLIGRQRPPTEPFGTGAAGSKPRLNQRSFGRTVRPVTSTTRGSRWRFVPARANGQLAFGTYLCDEDRDRYVPAGLDVVRLRGAGIAEVVAFLTADLSTFGLPAQLPR